MGLKKLSSQIVISYQCVFFPLTLYVCLILKQWQINKDINNLLGRLFLTMWFKHVASLKENKSQSSDSRIASYVSFWLDLFLSWFGLLGTYMYVSTHASST